MSPPMTAAHPRRRALRACLLALMLLAIAAVARAADGKPFYLLEAISDIPAGSHTYRVWFTTNCGGNQLPDCSCVTTTLDNDCLATIDADNDGDYDIGPDHDSDGILDLVDVDYTIRWTGSGTVTESIPLMIQDIISTYVGDWGFREPYFIADENRPLQVYNMPQFEGLAHSSGIHVDLDTRRMQEPAPSPREAVIHELWHMTQNAYNANFNAGNWFTEGQARFMQDKVFPEIDDSIVSGYYSSARILLANPNFNRGQDVDGDYSADETFPGGLLSASYDAALWWTYLTEQAGTGFAGTSGEGVDFLQDVFDQTTLFGFHGQIAVDLALQNAIGQTFDRTYLDFVVANYAKDKDVSLLDPAKVYGRDPQTLFHYRDEDPIGSYRTVTRTIISTLPDGGAVDALDLTVAPAPGGTLEVTASGDMPGYGANYYEVILPPASSCPVVRWEVEGEPDARLFNAWLLEQADTNGVDGAEIIDYQEHIGEEFEVSVLNSDGAPDYTRIVGIVATMNQPEGYTWQVACVAPILNIVVPVSDEPAAVGAPDAPGSFELWLQVVDDKQLPIAGLDATRDFRITVGDQEAQILSGEYVQDQYWLVVKAPVQPGAAVGDLFAVTAELVVFDADDTHADAILYDTLPTDKVLIIDRSGSMNVNGRLASAKAAARIKASASNAGDWLGVVSFHDNAAVEFPMTFVPDQDDTANVRANAHTAINAITLGNQTSIGDGLFQATNLLNNLATSNPDTVDDRWLMVLLSDGAENQPRFWADVKDDVIATGADVHAIAFGDQADDGLMHEIARLTCSERRVDLCYWVLNDVAAPVLVQQPAAPGDLTNPLADIYLRIDEATRGRQRLWQKEGSGGGVFQVIVTEEKATDGLFSVNWRDPAAPVNVTINGPAPAAFISRVDGATHHIFYTADLPAGTYTVQINGAGAEWIASLSARVIEGAEMRAAFDNTLAERAVGEPARLRVSLVDGVGPVAASVTALVTRPDSSTETIILRDDGEGADAQANDGIYSYDYDRINEVEEHNYAFDVEAHGEGFARYLRATYRPVDTTWRDQNNDDLLDNWQQRYGVVGGNDDDDQDDLTNRQEMLLGTNPIRADTDGGGENDGSEFANGRATRDPDDDAIPPLVDVWAENGDGRVILHFSQWPEYGQVRVWRRDAVAPYALLGNFPAAAGVITDTGLANGASYLYILQPLAQGGSVRGAYSNVILGQAKEDPEPPEGTFRINHNAPETGSLAVTLHFFPSVNEDGAPDFAFIKVSNDPHLADVPWQPFTTTLPWTIAPDPETNLAIVYATFQDAAGNVMPYTTADAILYNPELTSEPGEVIGADDASLEVGTWWISDYPPPGPSLADVRSARQDGRGLQTILTASASVASVNLTGPWTTSWSLGATNSNRRQWQRAERGGLEQRFVDAGDLAYFAGQGRPGALGFVNRQGDLERLTPLDGLQSYGDGDLEWMALTASRALDPATTRAWAATMRGLRLLMGFESTRADLPLGIALGRYLRLGYTLPQAWLKAADRLQPAGTTVQVIAERPEYLNDMSDAHAAETTVDDAFCALHHSVGQPLELAHLAGVGQLPTLPLAQLTAPELQDWLLYLAETFGVPTHNPILDTATGTVVSQDGRLEVDIHSGAYHYSDLDALWRWQEPPAGSRALTPAEAQQLAQDYLEQHGLLPLGIEVDRVLADTVTCGNKLGENAVAARVVNLAAYQVIFTRAINVPLPEMEIALPVLGPGGAVKVYVSSYTMEGMTTADHIVGVIGVHTAASEGRAQAATVQLLTPQQIAALAADGELAALVALNPPALEEDAQRQVVGSSLGYWQGPLGWEQNELIPIYAVALQLALADGAVVNYTLQAPAAAMYMAPLARIARVEGAHGELWPRRVKPGASLTLEALDALTPLTQAGHDASLDFVLGSGQADAYTYAWYLDEVAEAARVGQGRTIVYTLPEGLPTGSEEPHTLILEVTDTASPRQNRRSYATHEFIVGGDAIYLPAIAR